MDFGDAAAEQSSESVTLSSLNQDADADGALVQETHPADDGAHGTRATEGGGGGFDVLPSHTAFFAHDDASGDAEFYEFQQIENELLEAYARTEEVTASAQVLMDDFQSSRKVRKEFCARFAADASCSLRGCPLADSLVQELLGMISAALESTTRSVFDSLLEPVARMPKSRRDDLAREMQRIIDFEATLP